jgi:hypothetical protein
MRTGLSRHANASPSEGIEFAGNEFARARDWAAFCAKGAALKATGQPIDTSTAAGKCFLDMLGVFAEFETNLRRERQLEGIAKAKAAGVYKGRPASINEARAL